ncbi:MAG: METTL5 family protein [Thermoplasmata archaeon]
MEPVACPTIKRKDLAIFLQNLDPLPRPKDDLEQYPVPAEVAAEVLFRAYGHRDVWQREVADLGCGNGVLAVGAAHLDASRVVALDLDEEALAVARSNAASHGLRVAFARGDVRGFNETVDTVFMNPPFGGQRKHADRPFLQAAIRAAPVVYTFHHASTDAFVEREVNRLGAVVQDRRTYMFPLPHSQPYHREHVSEVEVAQYRIVKAVS